MKKLVEVKNMTKLFPVQHRKLLTALNSVSFDIMEKETLGLIGESGSGKSTAGRCILNLIPLTKGTLIYKGIDYSKLNKTNKKLIRSEMQMVFQDPYYSLNPRVNIWNTVETTLRSHGYTKQERERMTYEALMRVHIRKEDFNKYAHQISAGQQQRVGIARATAAKPKFIVLDEPTSSLDVSVRAEIIELLNELQGKLGTTYLFISHDLSTIEHICHRVAVLYLGDIVEYGKVEEVFHHHVHPYSRALLASVMVPDPEVKKEHYKLTGEIPSAIDLPKGCSLASRCPEVEARCFTERPQLMEVTPGHFARCFHAKENAKSNDWGFQRREF